jgi:guanine nucleotide-binding protein G(i) subunit alpha
MRIIYLEGFSNSERDQFKAIIYSNLATSMAAMLRACQQFQYELLPDNQVRRFLTFLKSSQPASEYILSTNFMISSDMSEDLASFYKSLWTDPAVQQALSRSSEYQLYDSTEL